MNKRNKIIKELKNFLLLWSTQTLSALGSSMTNFALIIWSFQEKESALVTALLSVSSYAPYVLVSIFAGALSDKWNKKYTMLISDTFAAICTIIVLLLLKTGNIQIWHLYCLNALNGLMNSIQQPASEVAVSMITPKEHYQKASGLRSFSYSLTNMLTPVLATAVLAFGSIQTVIFIDLLTFSAAFLTLLFGIKIPAVKSHKEAEEKLFQTVKEGLLFLKGHRGVLDLILFLAAINFTASIFNAALPAFILPHKMGGRNALGIINGISGAAMLAGSILVSVSPAPKSRVRVICNALLLSMSTENFILAFGSSLPIWCIGAALGWIAVPVMSANMDVLLRSRIPVEMQGRVYAARNTLQFFTIPVGYLLGGVFVDQICEPYMHNRPPESILSHLLGRGQGAGAALVLMIIGAIGVITCLIFRKDRHIWQLEK